MYVYYLQIDMVPSYHVTAVHQAIAYKVWQDMPTCAQAVTAPKQLSPNRNVRFYPSGE
jgi:hypothetical protein